MKKKNREAFRLGEGNRRRGRERVGRSWSLSSSPALAISQGLWIDIPTEAAEGRKEGRITKGARSLFSNAHVKGRRRGDDSSTGCSVYLRGAVSDKSLSLFLSSFFFLLFLINGLLCACRKNGSATATIARAATWEKEEDVTNDIVLPADTIRHSGRAKRRHAKMLMVSQRATLSPPLSLFFTRRFGKGGL